MIIKKWSGSSWVEQYPKTTIADIFLADGTTAAFAGSKIAESLLPNSVFDSLKFDGVVSGAASAANFALALEGIVDQANTDDRSAVGFYLVINAGGTINQATSSVQTTLGNNLYYQWTFKNDDSGATSVTSSGVLEAGDWIVVTSISGAGTSGNPYVFELAVVNNTYERATSTVAGIIELGSDTVQSTAANAVSSTASRTYALQINSAGQGVINVPWTDNNTTYTAGSGLSLVGTTFSHSDTSSASSSSNTGRTYIQSLVVDEFGHVTSISTATETVVDTNTTYTAGGGLGLAGTVFSHADTSSAANLTASSRTYVSALTFDTYGHVTGYSTATETVVDTNTTYSAGNGIALTGTSFSVAGGEGLTQEASGLKMTYPIYHGDTLPTSGISTNAIGIEW